MMTRNRSSVSAAKNPDRSIPSINHYRELICLLFCLFIICFVCLLFVYYFELWGQDRCSWLQLRGPNGLYGVRREALWTSSTAMQRLVVWWFALFCPRCAGDECTRAMLPGALWPTRPCFVQFSPGCLCATFRFSSFTVLSPRWCLMYWVYH